jgi:hypothetical protein
MRSALVGPSTRRYNAPPVGATDGEKDGPRQFFLSRSPSHEQEKGKRKQRCPPADYGNIPGRCGFAWSLGTETHSWISDHSPPGQMCFRKSELGEGLIGQARVSVDDFDPSDWVSPD